MGGGERVSEGVRGCVSESESMWEADGGRGAERESGWVRGCYCHYHTLSLPQTDTDTPTLTYLR